MLNTPAGSPFPPVGPRWGETLDSQRVLLWQPLPPSAASDCPLLGQGSSLGTPGQFVWGGAWHPLPSVTLCPCAPGSAGRASLLPEPGEPDSPWTGSRGHPRPPPHHPTTEGEGAGSPIISGVFSAGRRTRSWASSPPSHLCCTPILTSPVSSRITQVPVGQSKGDSLQHDQCRVCQFSSHTSSLSSDWSDAANKS